MITVFINQNEKDQTISNDITIFNKTDLEIPLSEDEAKKITELLSKRENRTFSFVEVVYVNEEGIISVNKKFLNRDYVTDIISFHYSDDSNDDIEGTLYCCAPRIVEQADEYNQNYKTEFLRIFIHGLLHLIGYEDQTKEEQMEMREKEDYYLNLSMSYEK